MSIEEEIRKYKRLANDERSRRIMMQKTHPSRLQAFTGLPTFEAEYRQIANWLQELKERREKESRREEVIRDPDEPYSEGLNTFKPYLTIKVDEDMMHRVIDEVIDNLYYECKNCGQKMFPQRKEESK